MLTIRSSIEPDVRTTVDRNERSLTVEVLLPGVQTESILLKVHAHSLFVQASTPRISYAKHVLLHHPVVHQRARAVLRRDRLHIVLPLQG